VYQYLPTGSLNTDNTIRTLTSGRQNFPQTYYVIEFSKNCACFNIEIISITCTTPTTDARGGHVLGCNGINQCRYNRGLVSDNNPTPPAMGPSPVSNFYGTFTNVERVKMELNSRFTVNVRIW
jgi:hypothetical protein